MPCVSFLHMPHPFCRPPDSAPRPPSRAEVVGPFYLWRSSRFLEWRLFPVTSSDVALAFRPAFFSEHASRLPLLFVAQLPSRSAGLRLFPVISSGPEKPQD